jgi:hypothetical protein
MNLAKSKFQTGQAPKEQTVTITEKGGDLEVMVKGVTADGTPISNQYTAPLAGGAGKVIQSTTYDGVSTKPSSNPGQRQITYTKGGKPIMTVNSSVSADGKTMTVRVKGTDPTGKPVAGTALYEKQ